MVEISAVAPMPSVRTNNSTIGQPDCERLPEPALWRASHLSSGVSPITRASSKTASTEITRGPAAKACGCKVVLTANKASTESGKQTTNNHTHKTNQPY